MRIPIVSQRPGFHLEHRLVKYRMRALYVSSCRRLPHWGHGFLYWHCTWNALGNEKGISGPQLRSLRRSACV